ncbi:hypothetical protein M407DRAFT_20084 [Tulasnella calospora MUT 4182]|uniref:MARVEL domain-containing protein n=1 Tax=Tulasnella calospora MUT 4182 TaxID=1051891 RepID=A0A0C3QQV6_9AGAM|nr:hypothetical protein M407DRAFT_20084 [Tulasnella calospora MUT 4182]
MARLRISRKTLLIWSRVTAYLLVSAIASSVIGISAYLEYVQHWKPLAVYLLPLIIGISTVLLVLPMAVLDRLRRDAAVHQPRVELCWAAVVTLAWLAAAMFFTLQMQGFPSCSIYRGRFFSWNNDSQFGWCRLHIAVQALLWAGFAILVLIILGILAFCLWNSSRGYHYVWSTAISDFEIAPKIAPSVMFEREQRERAQALDETLANLALQQRYQASLADSGPPRDRPPSPTLSVRSAMRSLGYVPERSVARLAVERNPSEQTLPVSIRSAHHAIAGAQHSSQSLVTTSNHNLVGGDLQRLETTSTSNRVYGAAL